MRSNIVSLLHNYKYRILVGSLFLFLWLMRASPRNIVPLLEEWVIFKIALWIIIIVAMIVSYGVHTKSTFRHGIISLSVLIITSSSHMSPIIDYIMWILIISFFMRITLAIIKTILYDKHIGSDLLIWCLAWYMMIGISGFLFFGMLDTYVWFDGFRTAATNNHISMFTILYYSFVTLLTIGYGDVVPVSPSIQFITIIYSLIGRSYSTFILAMILKKFDSKYL